MYYRAGDHDSEQDMHEQHEHHDHHDHMEHEMIQPMHMCPWANNCPMLHMNMMMHNQAMPYGGEMEEDIDDEDNDGDLRQFYIRPKRPYNPYNHQQYYHPRPHYPRPQPFFFNLYPPYPPYPIYPPYHNYHSNYDDYDHDHGYEDED